LFTFDVAVKFRNSWYPGEIVNLSQSDDIEVKCMKIIGDNKFVWPERADISWYDVDDVACLIEAPIPVSQRAFGLQENEYLKVNSMS